MVLQMPDWPIRRGEMDSSPELYEGTPKNHTRCLWGRPARQGQLLSGSIRLVILVCADFTFALFKTTVFRRSAICWQDFTVTDYNIDLAVDGHLEKIAAGETVWVVDKGSHQPPARVSALCENFVADL